MGSKGGIEAAGSEELWARQRVVDAGRYRKQPSPDGPRVIAVNSYGSVIAGPLNDLVLERLHNAGFEESSDANFSGGAIKPDEVFLPGNYAISTPEDGSPVAVSGINPTVRSGDWQDTVRNLTPPDTTTPSP